MSVCEEGVWGVGEGRGKAMNVKSRVSRVCHELMPMPMIMPTVVVAVVGGGGACISSCFGMFRVVLYNGFCLGGFGGFWVVIAIGIG